MKKLIQVIKQKIYGQSATGVRITGPCGIDHTVEPDRKVSLTEWGQNILDKSKEVYEINHR